MRYAHTNLIARDWRKLSLFYQEAFGCIPVGPKRDLSGRWIEELTGIEHVHIVGEHLQLPGYDGAGPTLEIFSYETPLPGAQALNACGFAHIAFAVEDVGQAVDRVIRAGGSAPGKIVSRDYGAMGTGTFVYVRDPEGNVVELQTWRQGG